MVSPITVAIVYAVVGSVVVLGVLKLMGGRPDAREVVGACVAGALASLIPIVGDAFSLVVTLGMLYWRGAGELRDIGLAVTVARLSMIPVLVALRLAHHQ